MADIKTRFSCVQHSLFNGNGTEGKARSVFHGLSTIFVLSSERRSFHGCEESFYPGG